MEDPSLLSLQVTSYPKLLDSNVMGTFPLSLTMKEINFNASQIEEDTISTTKK